MRLRLSADGSSLATTNLVVAARLTTATGDDVGRHFSGRRASRPRRVALGADRAYDTAWFAAGLRPLNVTSYLAWANGWGAHIEGRATWCSGYAASHWACNRFGG